MRRHEIKDADWERIRNLLSGKAGDPGVTAKDNRLFVNAVLWIAKTGAPWRDLPERFGNWNSVAKRFARWARKGVWEHVFSTLQDPDLEWLLFDSTVVRRISTPQAQKGAKLPGVGPLAGRILHQDPRRDRRIGQPDAFPAERWPGGGCHLC